MRGRKRAATKQPGGSSSSRQGGLGLQLTANPCKMLGTRDVDKIQTEEYQDCAGCGAQVINPGSSFPPFGAPYGTVNYHVGFEL
ncbi:aspartate kinase [Corchorus capsularis]|uniref:Aspartate kinase n=1 Tax=Corchorus capsularis TaxID=210143 RepID=A0A1R3G6T3_COCAP|nr:aspartate kinase [Corchorus capsularis]